MGYDSRGRGLQGVIREVVDSTGFICEVVGSTCLPAGRPFDHAYTYNCKAFTFALSLWNSRDLYALHGSQMFETYAS
jgi:hypothetical protein